MSWAERKFRFDFPAEEYPQLIERLRGTPARLESLVAGLPHALLVRRDGEKWSIQENAGHLISVDELFAGRLDDYETGAEELRPAEMTGRSTFAAAYNDTTMADVLAQFRRRREAHVARLASLPPAAFGAVALHPRLQQPMRLCDMLFFWAEHDQHHLARIQALATRREQGERK